MLVLPCTVSQVHPRAAKVRGLSSSFVLPVLPGSVNMLLVHVGTSPSGGAGAAAAVA